MVATETFMKSMQHSKTWTLVTLTIITLSSCMSSRPSTSPKPMCRVDPVIEEQLKRFDSMYHDKMRVTDGFCIEMVGQYNNKATEYLISYFTDTYDKRPYFECEPIAGKPVVAIIHIPGFTVTPDGMEYIIGKYNPNNYEQYKQFRKQLENSPDENGLTPLWIPWNEQPAWILKIDNRTGELISIDMQGYELILQ